MSSLGTWLTPQARDGETFKIQASSLRDPKDFRACIDEAIRMRELTGLYVVVDAPPLARIVINPDKDPKEVARITTQWDVRCKHGTTETVFIGRPYELAFKHNDETRTRRLTKSPRLPAMAIYAEEELAYRSAVSSSSDKRAIKLAERWARFMQPMLGNSHITTNDAVHASLYLADPKGNFYQKRRTVLRHLEKFWPHYSKIREVLG